MKHCGMKIGVSILDVHIGVQLDVSVTTYTIDTRVPQSFCFLFNRLRLLSLHIFLSFLGSFSKPGDSVARMWHMARVYFKDTVQPPVTLGIGGNVLIALPPWPLLYPTLFLLFLFLSFFFLFSPFSSVTPPTLSPCPSPPREDKLKNW